jgi:hypothetical protein
MQPIGDFLILLRFLLLCIMTTNKNTKNDKNMTINASATLSQLRETPSMLDGLSAAVEWQLRVAACCLVRAACRLLRLPLACCVV